MDICNNRDRFLLYSCVYQSPNKPDCGAKSRQTLRGILDIANNARYEADGPFMFIYVKSWLDLC